MLHNVAWFSAVPQALFVFIGICEFLGGIGLMLPAMTGVKPKLTPSAAIGLTLIMTLAAIFHIVRGESHFFLPVNLVLGGIAAFIAYGRLIAMPIAARSNQHSPHGYRRGHSGGSGSRRLHSGLVPDDACSLIRIQKWRKN